jgi:hypothetical protein
MLKNLLYALLLGVGMAACLSDRDNTDSTTDDSAITEVTEAEVTPSTDPTDFIIDKGRVGNIRIGMPIEEMRQLTLQSIKLADTTLQLEGQASTAYTFSSPVSPSGLIVEQQCDPDCKVWRIRIRDDHYRTVQGIGPGSKYAEVLEHHPISYASLGEGGFIAVSETHGMSFILDTSQLDQAQLHRLKPAEIPANTVVRGILIY